MIFLNQIQKRRLKQISRSKKKIFVKIDKLKSMFEKIVNERNKDNKEQEEANEQTINDFLKKYEVKTIWQTIWF